MPTNVTPEAQDYLDDLQMWGHLSAQVTLLEGLTAQTDLMLTPRQVRVMFRALAEDANRENRMTAKQVADYVLTLESLGTWEERLIAAVHIARGEVQL